ncbi:MFS transporter [Robertmurraya sp. DFI.2.37]|uniref:MFS transporter n=1 Tax=Robertmurraya sp. DFI.2.37 TaxID=3031819 RepID=UPI0012464E2D|nr:MFS transporter [Robertmurraya sp. DFI.2.37]MDF1509046.1 MFS transporter [Robertmurraya sp. DFI.2.37]
MPNSVKRNITLFLIGKLTAVLGSSIYGFAIGLFILAETGSSLNFSITLLVSVLPRIVLAPIAGTLSDRWDRKKIIIISDFACALWLGLIFIIFTSFQQQIWLLFLATFILSSLNTFYSTAVTSAIHNMVGPNYIQKAMSLNQAVVSISTILGPVLGGVLFGFTTISTFMVLNIIAFTLSGLASIFINYQLFAKEKEETKQETFFTEFKIGLTYVKQEAFIKNLIFLAVFLNFWFAVFPVALPYLVLTIRGMESYQLGVIEGAFSIGMLVMSVILAQLREIKNKKRSVFGGLFGLSSMLILLGVPNFPGLSELSNIFYFPFLIILVIFLSAFIMLINMPVMVLLQKNTPDNYRGRVMSLVETGASCMTPLGFIVFGFLLESLPVWLLLLICGCSTIIIAWHSLKNKQFMQQLNRTINDNFVAAKG